jgi:hypothetical protein
VEVLANPALLYVRGLSVKVGVHVEETFAGEVHTMRGRVYGVLSLPSQERGSLPPTFSSLAAL